MIQIWPQALTCTRIYIVAIFVARLAAAAKGVSVNCLGDQPQRWKQLTLTPFVMCCKDSNRC